MGGKTGTPEGDHPACTSKARKAGDTGGPALLGREGGALASRLHVRELAAGVAMELGATMRNGAGATRSVAACKRFVTGIGGDRVRAP